MNNQPIGIFDSGLGGVTVLRSLLEQFPNESFIYVGDLARLPYGNKSPATIRKYGEQVLNYLSQFQIKAAVIACNTASTMFLGENNYKNIPLFNVIEPGALAAFQKTQSKKVGVIATSATVRAHAYKNELMKLSSDLEVEELATPLLVPLAEEGWVSDQLTQEIIKRYLKDFHLKFDTLILGCTHYPILKNDIQTCVGSNVTLIESGRALGNVLEQHLKAHSMESSAKNRSVKIMTTDLTEHFENLALKLVRPFEIDSFERVVL